MEKALTVVHNIARHGREVMQQELEVEKIPSTVRKQEG